MAMRNSVRSIYKTLFSFLLAAATHFERIRTFAQKSSIEGTGYLSSS